MYIPAAFRVEDQQTIFGFIDSHGFATLVSSGANGSVATHLPLMLERAGTVSTLVGHFAKGNPQPSMCDGQQVLAIFHGPHAFISAAWYGRQNVVPTWNYVAVHVSGTLRIVHDKRRLLAIIEALTNKYESFIVGDDVDQQPWALGSVDSEFLDRMLDGIVGFEIEVEKLEGCWKLNQHHDADRRNRVIAALQQSEDQNDREIAELMAQV